MKQLSGLIIQACFVAICLLVSNSNRSTHHTFKCVIDKCVQPVMPRVFMCIVHDLTQQLINDECADCLRTLSLKSIVRRSSSRAAALCTKNFIKCRHIITYWISDSGRGRAAGMYSPAKFSSACFCQFHFIVSFSTSRITSSVTPSVARSVTPSVIFSVIFRVTPSVTPSSATTAAPCAIILKNGGFEDGLSP